MDRAHSRPAAWLAGTMALLACSLATGCNAVSLLMYTVNPNDVPAKFDGLQDKRVVVVCRSVAELQFADSTVPRDLTRQVSALLKSRVRKIRIVDEREVAEYTDENDWQHFTDVGKALKADMVVGIDLERFTLHQGQTLYQGQATVHLAVYDMTEGGQAVFEDTLPEVMYPPHTPISAADRSEAAFRRQFLGVLADQIGRYFYPHDSRADFATDANL
jgi:hypothetical protein